jgi:hypothetical protein
MDSGLHAEEKTQGGQVIVVSTDKLPPSLEATSPVRSPNSIWLCALSASRRRLPQRCFLQPFYLAIDCAPAATPAHRRACAPRNRTTTRRHRRSQRQNSHRALSNSTGILSHYTGAFMPRTRDRRSELPIRIDESMTTVTCSQSQT